MSGQPSLPLSSLSLRDEIFRLLAVHLSRAARHHDANMKRRKSRTNHARCERVNEKIVSDLNARAFGWNYRAVIGFKIGHCRQNRFFFLSLMCMRRPSNLSLEIAPEKTRRERRNSQNTREEIEREHLFVEGYNSNGVLRSEEYGKNKRARYIDAGTYRVNKRRNENGFRERK